ncbi:MAG: D-alanyl-D-alanine carboxypeptidase/D-alanyl-D-alanine-endopeptidase [Ignavibacteria bacterium CG22_combo_CG10-13_8_21_14_all_37_15]|nr:MAG: D-alanyl-D-alanine carboxypeptidase/D-alanyl-D-alanine-endopeptidase [Ignavibacteria bacterium CG22_combo_CG10-13_8_21_14_all_37_15]
MKKLILFLLVLGLVVPCYSQNIKAEIEKILQKVPAQSRYGIVVLNPMKEDTLFVYNASVPLVPASNTKLFTTAVAVYLLEPGYSISTKFFTDAKKIDLGRLDGNLYLKGYGNGLFRSDDLDQMIENLKRKGITEINGDVVGDDTFFDDIYSRKDWIEDETQTVSLPPVSALVLDRNKYEVRKKIRRKRYRVVTEFFSDPPLKIAEIVFNKLKAASIIVSGNFKKGETPKSATELTAHAIKLKDYLSVVNKTSDNYLAECLFKIVGAVSSAKEGSAFYAAQTINKFLYDNDIPSEGTKVVDGSGLSRNNKISVGAITGLLEKIYFDIRYFDTFYNSLSTAGTDGTLRNRMNNSGSDINFRGKTGTLNGASSVSGYLKLANGDDLIISMIFEFSKKNQNYYRDVEDKIIEKLAGFNYESGR